MRNLMFASAAVLACGAIMLPAQNAKSGDAAKGKEVFNEKCAACHNDDSTERKMGPGLKGLFAKDKLVTGKKPTYENVLALINEGDDNGMPPFKDDTELTDAKKKDLLAYLQTL